MRVLLVHPGDSPTAGEWSNSRWDLVLDLGWAGTSQYAIWSEELSCPTRGLYSFSDWHEGVRRMREIRHAGSDCLVDEEGIDWWELLEPQCFQAIYEFLLLLKIASEIQSPAEVRCTRPHRLADTFGKLLGVNVVPFIQQARPVSGVRRYTKALRTLTSAQVAGIALDKWDADYRIRRLLHGRRPSSSLEQKVLLPSAYRNVSRVLAAYASLLPDRHFLLVTTRADGAIQNLPPCGFRAAGGLRPHGAKQGYRARDRRTYRAMARSAEETSAFKGPRDFLCRGSVSRFCARPASGTENPRRLARSVGQRADQFCSLRG